MTPPASPLTNKFRARQAWTIAKIEMRRAFFSKRALWVYLLALFPAVMFFGHGLETRIRLSRLSEHVSAAAALNQIAIGQTEEQVLQIAGPPATDHDWTSRRRVERKPPPKPPKPGQAAAAPAAPPAPAAAPDDGDDDGDAAAGKDRPRVWEEQEIRHRQLMYFDGHSQVWVWFEDGKVKGLNRNTILNFEEDREVFAGIFQYFYLRLAIFFGCLGIFMNLFRGEMLDKTLHFWFLAPVRREVLLAGKYVAGLIAASVIFSAGALLAFAMMLWPHSAADIQAYWQGPGPAHAFWYVAAAALGCVGYGSVFLAAGLLIRNPIVPAGILLLWESINGFLPSVLQRLSVLYYLQSMAPVAAPVPSDMPAVFRLLLAPASPASRIGSVIGLMLVTALVLWVASAAVRRIQISYGTE